MPTPADRPAPGEPGSDQATTADTTPRPTATGYAVDIDKVGAFHIQAPDITLDLLPGWAYIHDSHGIAFAAPTDRIRTIQRLDDAEHPER